MLDWINFYTGPHPCSHHPYQHIGHLASVFFCRGDSSGQAGLRTTAQQMDLHTGCDTGFSSLSKMSCVLSHSWVHAVPYHHLCFRALVPARLCAPAPGHTSVVVLRTLHHGVSRQMSVSLTEPGASPAQRLGFSGSSHPQGEHTEPAWNEESTLLHPGCLLTHKNEL